MIDKALIIGRLDERRELDLALKSREAAAYPIISTTFDQDIRPLRILKHFAFGRLECCVKSMTRC